MKGKDNLDWIMLDARRVGMEKYCQMKFLHYSILDNNKNQQKQINRMNDIKNNIMRISHNSTFGFGTLGFIPMQIQGFIPMQIQGFITESEINEDGIKIINSIDLKSVNYTYHNPFSSSEIIKINEIKS